MATPMMSGHDLYVLADSTATTKYKRMTGKAVGTAHDLL